MALVRQDSSRLKEITVQKTTNPFVLQPSIFIRISVIHKFIHISVSKSDTPLRLLRIVPLRQLRNQIHKVSYT